MHDLSSKRALVIGATSGIGFAVTANLVSSGAQVMAAGRRAEAANKLEEMGARFVRCDITDEESVVNCLSEASAQLGGIDILVINAGVADDEESLSAYASEAMNVAIDTNLKGAFYALKHAATVLADGASVIYTGSVVGSGLTHAGAGVYAAGKAGGAYLARTAAIENAERGIRVNTVCPALIADTGMMVADDGNDTAQFLGQLNAFGRMGRLDEVVGIYNFLASDAASFITGQEIRVDGGMTAGFGNPLMGGLAGG